MTGQIIEQKYPARSTLGTTKSYSPPFRQRLLPDGKLHNARTRARRVQRLERRPPGLVMKPIDPHDVPQPLPGPAPALLLLPGHVHGPARAEPRLLGPAHRDGADDQQPAHQVGQLGGLLDGAVAVPEAPREVRVAHDVARHLERGGQEREHAEPQALGQEVGERLLQRDQAVLDRADDALEDGGGHGAVRRGGVDGGGEALQVDKALGEAGVDEVRDGHGGCGVGREGGFEEDGIPGYVMGRELGELARAQTVREVDAVFDGQKEDRKIQCISSRERRVTYRLSFM